MSREDKAVELFSKGYNCAQSVLGVFCEGEGLDRNTALKLANGFGGGVRCGEVCGAISGAIMAIGLKYGYYDEGDIRQKACCNRISYEFMEKFIDANGSALCRELLGINIRHPDDHNAPAAKIMHKSICPKLVASAVMLLESTMFDASPNAIKENDAIIGK